VQPAAATRPAAASLLAAAADAAAAAAVSAGAAPPPPLLCSQLPPLLCTYLLDAAAEGALAPPPETAARCGDAEDPGAAPAAALLLACPALAAATLGLLAQAAGARPRDALTALAALVGLTALRPVLVGARESVAEAAAAVAQGSRWEGGDAAVCRHLAAGVRLL